MDELKTEKREIVKVVLLNSKNIIMKIKSISFGGTNSANIDPKDVFMDAIKSGAPKVILIHNHPSGDSTPSKQDNIFTNKMEEAARLLGIQLLDHIIIGNDTYTSIREKRHSLNHN